MLSSKTKRKIFIEKFLISTPLYYFIFIHEETIFDEFSRIAELIIKICAILCIELIIILRGKFRGDFTKLYANFREKIVLFERKICIWKLAKELSNFFFNFFFFLRQKVEKRFNGFQGNEKNFGILIYD